MTTLKPCPFCGSKAEVTPNGLVVFCTCDDCRVQTSEAIACVTIWNRRSPEVEEALRDAREALSGLLTAQHLNLGDLVYQVREREGLGWEGPAVKAWSAAVMKARAALARIEGVK